MKQFILLLAVILFIASCKSNADENTGAVQLLPAVTAYNNTAVSDTSSTKSNTSGRGKSSVKTITKIIYVTKKSSGSAADVDKTNIPASSVPEATPVTPSIPASETSAPVSAPLPGTVNDNGSTSSVPETVKKTGWNNAAKGAAIGAGAGAIGGAIFSKKKGLGAVVGGIVGAAGGYIIGKNIDKKSSAK